MQSICMSKKKNSEAKDKIILEYNSHIFNVIYEKCLGSKVITF